jgi:hypothetical protein
VAYLSRSFDKLRIRRRISSVPQTYENVLIRLESLLTSIGDLKQKETWPLIIFDDVNVSEDSEHYSEWKELLRILKELPCFVLVFCREPLMAKQTLQLLS